MPGGWRTPPRCSLPTRRYAGIRSSPWTFDRTGSSLKRPLLRSGIPRLSARKTSERLSLGSHYALITIPPACFVTSRLDNVPAAPAARLIKAKKARNQLDYGILKVIVEGSDTPFYVQGKDDGDFIITVDSTHAARFRFDSESNSKLLEYMVGPYDSGNDSQINS